MRQRLLGYMFLAISFTCSGQQTGTDKQVISLTIGYENAALSLLIDDFEQHYPYQVETRTFDNAALKTALLQHGDKHQLPDAALVPADFLGLSSLEYSQVDASLISSQTGQQFSDSAKVDGDYLGIPIIAGNHLILYYNNQLVTQVASSWQQLRQQQHSVPAQHLLTWSYNEMYWLIPFATAMQSTPLAGQRIQLNTPEMRQALKFYLATSQQGLVDQDCDYSCSIDNFSRGNSAYLISGVWSYRQLKVQLGDNLGISTLPTLNGNPMRSYFSSHVLAFPGNSLKGPKRQALLAFAQHLQRPSMQKLLWDKMQVLPVNSDILKQITAQADANTANIIRQLNQSVPMPNSYLMALVWEAMSIGFRRYAADVISVEQATLLMQHLAEQSARNLQQQAN